MIRVNEDYAVLADSSCYSAAKRYVAGEGTKNAGQESWLPFAHHPTLYAAVSAIVRRLQREAVQTTDMDLKEATKALKAVEMRVHEWLRDEIKA